ncbi:hypothetical protein HanRHA438_Chr15g0702601 [Helianthus annuus]|uniref:Uncharacterized protein n=1 Tax=Helianthus annuus TaxID=4232 RepID=A0A9K3H1X4_HELAN|nr:hypothetical protein HanXRQr2_Chr15g0690171 [Helianthus annuus]KAJ0831005.1 hypothetical protein HanPSC8_Chr15g0662041 [Helianthus annuus]KAJ0844448.1 hypothetical protein HanRHA438_Chr15g0702601 [Helianthus annuus]
MDNHRGRRSKGMLLDTSLDRKLSSIFTSVYPFSAGYPPGHHHRRSSIC